MSSELTNNKQNLSFRINEVHCGILEMIKRCRNKYGMTPLKRYRNSFHSCGMTLANSLFTIHKRQLTKFAFTLAETLVVMGIIGVVAALTIPNLNQSTGDREKVAKVKKIYSNLEDAYGRATAVYGPLDEWFFGTNSIKERNKRFLERLIEFMKVSKNCEYDEGCFSSAPLLGVDASIHCDNFLEDELLDNDAYMVILADGTSLEFDSGRMYVDIDGPNKGKNQIGVDIFNFHIILADNDKGMLKHQIYPSQDPSLWTGDFNTSDKINTYATAWVINNGNLDYLKCKNLNWETKTSCK